MCRLFYLRWVNEGLDDGSKSPTKMFFLWTATTRKERRDKNDEKLCVSLLLLWMCVGTCEASTEYVGGQIPRTDREKIFFMFSCYICVTTSYTWMAIHLESISYTCSVRARVANKTHEKDTKHEATTLNGDIKEKRRDQGRWTNIMGTRARSQPNERKCTAFL